MGSERDKVVLSQIGDWQNIRNLLSEL